MRSELPSSGEGAGTIGSFLVLRLLHYLLRLSYPPTPTMYPVAREGGGTGGRVQWLGCVTRLGRRGEGQGAGGSGWGV